MSHSFPFFTGPSHHHQHTTTPQGAQLGVSQSPSIIGPVIAVAVLILVMVVHVHRKVIDVPDLISNTYVHLQREYQAIW